MGVLLAGAVYFVTVYAAGFVLGTVRELLLVPAFGAFTATAIEAPVMLAVCFLAARWVTLRSNAGYSLRQRLMIGIFAFCLLMLAELVLAHVLRGLSFTMWLEHFATPQGALSGVLFGVFAILPALVGGARKSGIPPGPRS